MRFLLAPPLACLLLWLVSCSPDIGSSRAIPDARIAASEQKLPYFAWDAKKPILLLGTVSRKNPFLANNFELELESLHEAGGNYVRCEVGSHYRNDPRPFRPNPLPGAIDSLIPDSLFWANFRDYLHYAASLSIVVQLDFPAVTDRSERASVVALREKAIELSQAYPNVLYSEATESRTDDDRPTSSSVVPIEAVPFADNYPASTAFGSPTNETTDHLPTVYSALSGNDPYDAIKRFNLAAMGGYAGLCYASDRNHAQMRGAQLASIRAIRTVERHLNFWDLQPAPDVLIGTNASAATDGMGNYLFYMPTAGEIALRLPVENQVPIRVTVVGYLGTQKSELLRPPYGTVFKLFTDEIRGGWMILEREES